MVSDEEQLINYVVKVPVGFDGGYSVEHVQAHTVRVDNDGNLLFATYYAGTRSRLSAAYCPGRWNSFKEGAVIKPSPVPETPEPSLIF